MNTATANNSAENLNTGNNNVATPQVTNYLASLIKKNEFYKAGIDPNNNVDINNYKSIKNMLENLLNPNNQNQTIINDINALIKGFIFTEKITEADLEKKDIIDIIDTHTKIIDKVNENITKNYTGIDEFKQNLQESEFNETDINKIISSFDTLYMVIRINVLNRLHFKHTLEKLIGATNTKATEEQMKAIKTKLTEQLVNRLSDITSILSSDNIDEQPSSSATNKYKLLNNNNNNNNNNYLSKYMKYKNKYLSLKNNNYF